MTEENKEQQKSDWKNRELGALWRREGKQQNFLSGMVRVGEFGVEKELKIVVFTNKGKLKNERAPDFIIYEDRPRDVESLDATPSEASRSSESDEVPSGL